MSAHSYEIAHCIASENVKEDHTILNPAFEVIKNRTSLPLLTGVDADDGRFFLVIAWHDTSLHDDFTASPEFPAFAEMFAPALPDPPRGDISMVHAHFNRDPLPAFTAPITEHAYLTPKEGSTTSELSEVLEQMCKQLSEECGDSSVGAAWASAEERSDQLILLIGWESSEARRDCLTVSGPGYAIRSKLEQSIAPASSSFYQVTYRQHQ